jgi:hypothetical protein
MLLDLSFLSKCVVPDYFIINKVYKSTVRIAFHFF